jgi:hypothetical protein
VTDEQQSGRPKDPPLGRVFLLLACLDLSLFFSRFSPLLAFMRWLLINQAGLLTVTAPALSTNPRPLSNSKSKNHAEPNRVRGWFDFTFCENEPYYPRETLASMDSISLAVRSRRLFRPSRLHGALRLR